MDKIEALAKFLECDKENIEVSKYDDNTLEAEGGEYLVLTDEEANEKTKEYIKESLWAFRPEFIAAHSKALHNQPAIDSLRHTQEKCCEDANDIVMALVDDFDYLVEDAISCDGRGHFLSGYDGEENESGEYFIYRVN